MIEPANSGELQPAQVFELEQAYPDREKHLVTIGGVDLAVVYDTVRTETGIACDTIYIMGGDMILTNEQVEILSQPRTRGAITSQFVKYWPSGRVYYQINSDVPNTYRIQNAIAHWEANTGLRFYPRTSSYPNYITFTRLTTSSASASSSSVGMAGGQQYIKLSDGASTGTVIHEIGHAIGLFHEHMRADRDAYVDIYLNNLEDPSHASNFSKYSAGTGMDVGAFDYNSIMIYGSADGAKDGTYTMLKKDGSLIAGQRNGLSAGDIYTVRLLYGPPYVQVARENIVWYYYEGYAYSEDYNRLYFFSDKNPTSPVTRLAVSDHDRYVTVGYTCYNRSGSSISSFTSYRGYFIPAGTSVYSLGQTTYRSVEEYGNIVEHYDEQYFIPLGL